MMSYELHGFGDASDRAYCAMVYLVCVTNSGIFVLLMASKTRVAPLSKQVTARLELMTARITAQLKEAVEKALQSRITVNSVHMWSDSITALYWIKGEREWSQFVQNRVNEILRLTTRETWNHCPGVENPADLGSRGVTAVTIKSNKLWWRGPEWLSMAQEYWPSMNVGPTPESQVEMKASCRNNALLIAEKDASSIASIIPVNAYSSCEKLFRATAYGHRFVRNARLKEEGVSRGKWRLGKVEELITGKDDETRGAKIKVLTKKGRPMYLSRPVQGLCPLEVRAPVYARPIETNQVEEQVPVRRVPRRAAAINADRRRRYVDQLLADQGGSV